mmetsp:Transcript_7352/g.17681  ORF Transcript_7352/g.17681 Transcript_7352/m.17681 type:complete len:263 (-) Transcript_7352:242-1030(-)
MQAFKVQLTELPSVPAVNTGHEGGHRLIGRASLHLKVSCLPLLALGALELVGGCLLVGLPPLRLPQLELADLLVLLPPVGARELLGRERDELVRRVHPLDHAPAEVGVLRVLEVEVEAAELALVLLGDAAVLRKDRLLDVGSELGDPRHEVRVAGLVHGELEALEEELPALVAGRVAREVQLRGLAGGHSSCVARGAPVGLIPAAVLGGEVAVRAVEGLAARIALRRGRGPITASNSLFPGCDNCCCSIRHFRHGVLRDFLD